MTLPANFVLLKGTRKPKTPILNAGTVAVPAITAIGQGLTLVSGTLQIVNITTLGG